MLIQQAAKLFQNPKFRELLVDIKKKNELTIDHVSQDQVIEAGVSADALARARTIVESFEPFISQHKDEITALQILYGKPRSLSVCGTPEEQVPNSQIAHKANGYYLMVRRTC